MTDADIISRVISQYVFERQPPYLEEQIKKSMKEEVEIDYELKKVEREIKIPNPAKKT